MAERDCLPGVVVQAPSPVEPFTFMKKYEHHTCPELRQANNGYWYIWFNKRDRESLKTKYRNIAHQVSAIKKQEKRDADAEALKPKEEEGLKVFMEEYLEFRKVDGKEHHTVDLDSLSLRLLLEHAGDKPMSAVEERDRDLFHAWLQSDKQIKTSTRTPEVLCTRFQTKRPLSPDYRIRQKATNEG